MINFKMPAEWEQHKAIWLAWPHDEISFPGRLQKVRDDVAKIIQAIHHSEQVELLVLHEQMQKEAEQILQNLKVDLSKITFRQTEYMDGWLRDCAGLFCFPYSPLPLGEGKGGVLDLTLINFTFNTWGNKFPDLEIDKKIPEKISGWTDVKKIDLPMVLEGGAIDVNGQGTLLTTKQCLLNENRNPGLSKQDIENYLEKYLGVTKTIWLKKGLYNDHTDGHIDDIARFVSESTILCAYEENERDENYQTLKENFEQLSQEADANGKPFKLIKLPMPHFSYEVKAAGTHSNKAPASYTNFYIGNKTVLVPVYSDPNDQKALEIIEQCFPGRSVVGIECRDLVYGGGAIHCLTQQMPL